MTSAETASIHVAEISDSHTQHSPSARIPEGPSRPTHIDIDSGQITNSTPVRSIFGPFPASEDRIPPNQQTLDPVGMQPATVPPANDQTRQISNDSQPFNKMSRGIDSGAPETVPPTHTVQVSSPSSLSAPPLTREKTAPAIGPATDKPTPLPKESEIEGPVLYITLLLSSTGARHPYKLDAKYLRKRNVLVDGNNPINISLYKLKELILRDWREEWEAKPSSPESIRLISMGKMLNDKARLSDSGFTNGITPHIIHMTIKPQDIIDEEDAKMKSAGGVRGENERSPRCRCVIQ